MEAEEWISVWWICGSTGYQMWHVIRKSWGNIETDRQMVRLRPHSRPSVSVPSNCIFKSLLRWFCCRDLGITAPKSTFRAETVAFLKIFISLVSSFHTTKAVKSWLLEGRQNRFNPIHQAGIPVLSIFFFNSSPNIGLFYKFYCAVCFLLIMHYAYLSILSKLHDIPEYGSDQIFPTSWNPLFYSELPTLKNVDQPLLLE